MPPPVSDSRCFSMMAAATEIPAKAEIGVTHLEIRFNFT
jgi:hypothetical protein